MMEHGGFDIRNLLQGPSLALILLYLAVVAAVGLLHFSFSGSVVV